MRRRLSWILLLVCAFLLCVSVAANVLLAQSAIRDYRNLHRTRLDPLNLSYFPEAPTLDHGKTTAVFFGDSRAAQWPDPTGLPNIHFVNRGIGAQTSAQIAGRFGVHIRPWHPDIVIIQMGINDLKTIALFPAQQETIIANCQNNLASVVAESTNMGATVILTTIFPAGDIPRQRRPVWSPEIDTAVKTLNITIHALAAENVLILDAYTLLVDESGKLRPEFANDELHLNQNGYARLNTALTEMLIER